MANNNKRQSIIQLILFIGILIFVNILGSVFHGKFDLTEEKRFTLTKPTVDLLQGLDDIVDIRILLDGEFPAGFKRLQTATKEMLDDFRAETGWIEYAFEDPNDGPASETDARRKALADQDIRPTRLRVKDSDGTTEERFIYPFAILKYKGRSHKVNLLENEIAGTSDEAILNNSVSLLEYKMANAIEKLKSRFRPNIVYTSGHGELLPIQMADIRKKLNDFYEVGPITLDSVYQISQNVDVVMIPKPRAAFSAKDLFKIDQYLMNGGKVLWMVDMLNTAIDSIAIRRGVPYIPSENAAAEGIHNLLYKYGVRLRPGNLIFDVENSRIPLQVGEMGNTAQFDLFPWYYHLMITPKSDHPIVKGLDRVNLFFPTVIDTSVIVPTEMKKTVLLSSSRYSRVKPNTSRLSFDEVAIDPQKVKFDSPHQPVAVLLEGEFPSAYRNRVTASMSEGLKQLGTEFKEKSENTRMIVISDGDVIKNEVNSQSGEYLPLGYNKFEKYTFANKAFLLNCIEYLMNDNGVIEARSKEVKLRLLDTVKAQDGRTKWRTINIALPLVFLGIFGFLFNYIRRRRFAG